MREGYPLKAISRAMGHSSIAVTERYLRVSSEEDIRPMIKDLGTKIKSRSKSEKVATKMATLEDFRKSKMVK